MSNGSALQNTPLLLRSDTYRAIAERREQKDEWVIRLGGLGLGLNS